MEPLEQAIELCGVSGLAKACGVSPQAVHKWRVNGVPPERVLAIEGATLGRVTRHELRSDLYPEPSDEAHSRRSSDTHPEVA